jgi:hypothetical protein
MTMTTLSRDQRRRKKLKSRQQRTNRHSAALDRDRIAEAVHHAVCDYTGTDGSGQCAMYAVAGMGLLLGLRENACVQIGALCLQPDPGDPTAWISMDPANGWGEVHAWLALWKRPPSPGVSPSDVEIIDLSARHYRRYVEDMPSILPPGVAPIEKVWRQPGEPAYLWGTKDRLPKWVGFTVTEGLSRELMAEARNHTGLIRLSCQHFQRAS